MRISSLRWAVGAFCAMLGALMLVAPHQFSSAHYAPLQADLPWWAAGLLLAGAALLGGSGLAARQGNCSGW